MATIPSKKIKFNYEYISEPKDIIRVARWLENRKYFVYDTETSGTDPYNDSIILAQIGNDEKQWIIDRRNVSLSPLKEFFENPDILVLGQNIKFDWMFTYLDGIEITNVACTMIAEEIIRCGLHLPVNLKALAEHYLGIIINKDDDLRRGFSSTPVGKFTDEQLEYAAGDVIYPLLIAKHQKAIITKRGLNNTIKLEFAVLPVIAAMELAGMSLDTPAWLVLYQESLANRLKAEEKLDRFFRVKSFVQEDLFGNAIKVASINYTSTKQVLDALSKKGYIIASTEKEDVALAAINKQIPFEFAKALFEYRFNDTRANRYGLNVIQAIEPKTGRIHSSFTQAFTSSGRLSSGREKTSLKSNRINLQNLPHYKKYRECFIPRKGYKFIIYDLKSIEPRVMGDLSKDELYLNTFLADKDIYNEVGTVVYGEEVSKREGRPQELRAKAKIGVLGTAYGTGKNKFYTRMLLDINLDDDGLLGNSIKLISREETDRLWEGIVESCSTLRAALNDWSNITDPIMSSRKVYDDRVAMEPFQKVYYKVLETITKRFEKEKTTEELVDYAVELTKNRGHVTYSESVGGRKRFFKIYHPTWWTDGRNHPIQSTAGGDIMKTAMVKIHNKIKEHKHDAAIVNQVHDELIIEAREDHAQEVNEYVRKSIEDAGNKYLTILSCKVDGGIFDKWQKS